MSRRCPIYGSTVLYLDCLECEEKICKRSDKVNTYTKANEGHKFVPTEKADDKVKAKYDEVNGLPQLVKRHKYNVPTSWIEKGYVKEVKDE